MNKYLIIVIIVLLGIVGVGYIQLKQANEKWEKAEANVKEYDTWLSDLGRQNMSLQLTIDQVNSFKDSVLIELNNTRKELGIKDKNLKALQAIKSGFSKKDTIYIPGDTIFKEPTLAIDTLFGDEWYNIELGLRYPSMIAVKPYFKSEKHVIVSTKKETVNPPKKFFLFRWFQKKYTVLKVNVKEKNPYVQDESSEYIEVLK